jgi:predicted amidophosphoribosyltransferase
MALLDRLFDSDCAGCRAPGRLVCRSCLTLLVGPAAPAWPDPVPAGLPEPWAVTGYAGPARAILLAYKERATSGLASVLASSLANAVVAAADQSLAERSAADDDVSGPTTRPGLVLVPVPSSRRARRERADDVVLRLARGAAARLRRSGIDARVVAALHHVREVRDSAGLSADERAANLTAAFGLRRGAGPALDGVSVVLVDDVITTGSTLSESARVLRGCGAVVTGAATVAATKRRCAPRAEGPLGPGRDGTTVGSVEAVT